MANGWGGARPGSGRKRKAEKYSTEIEAAERRLADTLPKRLRTMERLANGGIEVTKLKRERVRVEAADGSVRYEMVITEAVTEKTLPDRKANEYLINRIMGNPAQEVDLDVTSNGATVGGLLSGLSNDEIQRLLEEGNPGGAPSEEVPDPAGSVPPDDPGD
jgi:hypothetical protein